MTTPRLLPAAVIDGLQRQLTAEHEHCERVSQTLKELAGDGMTPEQLGRYQERLDALSRDAETLATQRMRLRMKLAVLCRRKTTEVRLSDVLPACGAAREQLETTRDRLRRSASRLAGLVRSTAVSLTDWQGLLRGLLGEAPHEGRYDMHGQRTGRPVPVRIEARF
ncbi:hypothetical protein Mal4_45940 [Maioricimonas rarisocia]|uniref:FlgN protein n=1 Tax=Maioricimonas rarisocia TaxID=2528026 RepID=A0A517ZCL9_9PLAN|nr:hypothetical protein [Maioricimonas rarisocia]QDU40238.1 hypothetical protein Mal4_45940 [Maioricimonas rarisocia]